MIKQYLKRIVQQGLFSWMSDETYLRLFYRMKLGKKLDLEHPKRLTEKIQWLKIHDRNPEYTIMADKLKAKKWISDRIGSEYVVPTIGVWDDFDEIDFSKLPDQFVLKCNHDSGGNVIVKSKNSMDIPSAKRKINECMRGEFFWIGREWAYKDIERKIIAEPYLVDESGVELKDYKIFCFNGRPTYVEVDFNRFVEHKLNTYDFDWNPLNFCDTSRNDYDANISKPSRLDDMVRIAEKLSKDMKFLRVDFYSIYDEIYVGELTLYPGCGFIRFDPPEADEKLGELLNLNEFELKISNRASGIAQSLTRELYNYANELNDVIDLTLGDPDFDTPAEIKEAAIHAIRANKTHYTMNAGAYEVRDAISKKITEIWDVPCDPDKNVIVTVGGMEALYLALLSIVDNGDEVILFAPYYTNYYQMVQMCGGIPVVINAYDMDNGFTVNESQLESSISDKTVAIIVNSPNNPTGEILGGGAFSAIVSVAERHGLAIISDEVYRTLVYDGAKHESILQFAGARPRTILIDSLSKEYSSTGLRIGYAYGPNEVIASMVKLQENIAACANVPSQYALMESCCQGIASNDGMLHEFEKRRNLLCELLSQVPGIRFRKPQGAFYLFIDISALGVPSMEFARLLLEKKHVAVAPGKAYGENYDGYIRIAFTKSMENLREATSRLEELIIELR